MIAFGPVPSRRLGRSLGINNIPPKVCTYSCAYCQLGRTIQMRLQRQRFYDPHVVAGAVGRKLEAAQRAGEPIDYLAFVPDGEPTLDAGLGHAIRLLRRFSIPIAVLSNGSLVDRAEVREDLMEADWVSLKLDTVRDGTWRRVTRPHRRIALDSILRGMSEFAIRFDGTLATETMLLRGLNDPEQELRATAQFAAELRPAAAYLAVPTRPPAEDWVRSPDESVIARGYEVFRAWLPRVELLLGYEGDAFASTGDARDDLLSITAVHPMRDTAVRRMVERAGLDWGVVERLVDEGTLVEVEYGANRYFVRSVATMGGVGESDRSGRRRRH